MKKRYLKSISTFLFTALFVTGCQKSVTEPAAIKESSEVSLNKLPDASLKKQCQLTYFIDWGGTPNWVHYNNKGLADEWGVQFGSDIYTIHMKYDNKNLLSNAQIDINDITVATIEFVWGNNHISTEHWDLSGYLFDVTNTYNAKGQLVIRETTDGFRTNYEYTPEGNHQRDIVYFEYEPVQSDDYTYNQPNKNPYQAIQGLPYQFLYTNPIQTKWFATSDKFTVYDYEGNPFVVLDIDPSKTVMQMTDQNYLSAVTYYDKLTGETLSKNFEYQNCGAPNNVSPFGINGSQFGKNKSSDNNYLKRLPLLIGKPGDRKKQIEELKRHYLKKR